jgi:hypothetical protein
MGAFTLLGYGYIDEEFYSWIKRMYVLVRLILDKKKSGKIIITYEIT